MKQSTRIALLTIGALALGAALFLSVLFALSTQAEALRPLTDLGTIITVSPADTR